MSRTREAERHEESRENENQREAYRKRASRPPRVKSTERREDGGLPHRCRCTPNVLPAPVRIQPVTTFARRAWVPTGHRCPAISRTTATFRPATARRTSQRRPRARALFLPSGPPHRQPPHSIAAITRVCRPTTTATCPGATSTRTPTRTSTSTVDGRRRRAFPAAGYGRAPVCLDLALFLSPSRRQLQGPLSSRLRAVGPLVHGARRLHPASLTGPARPSLTLLRFHLGPAGGRVEAQLRRRADAQPDAAAPARRQGQGAALFCRHGPAPPPPPLEQ